MTNSFPGRVVNIRRTNKYDVFIGRGSKWGNPFPITDKCSRELVLAKFEVHLRHQPDLIAVLPELADKILGCFCHPLPCHGQILLQLLWEFHGIR